MKGIKFILTLVLLAAASAASAQIYTWKDTNGRVHYSDQPPPEANAKPIKSKTPSSSVPDTSTSTPAAGGKSTPKTWQEKDVESRQKKAEQTQADEKKKQEQAKLAQKEQHCNDLRKNLAMLERGGRIGRPNDKGELEFLSDDQLAKESSQVRTQISRDCK